MGGPIFNNFSSVITPMVCVGDPKGRRACRPGRRTHLACGAVCLALLIGIFALTYSAIAVFADVTFGLLSTTAIVFLFVLLWIGLWLGLDIAVVRWVQSRT